MSDDVVFRKMLKLYDRLVDLPHDHFGSCADAIGKSNCWKSMFDLAGNTVESLVKSL